MFKKKHASALNTCVCLDMCANTCVNMSVPKKLTAFRKTLNSALNTNMEHFDTWLALKTHHIALHFALHMLRVGLLIIRD
jgi:hypothetical protein